LTLKRPTCPTCGSKAEWYRATKNDVQRIYCRICAKPFSNVSAPRVLLFDIETSTINATVSGTGEQRINHEQITDDFYITSWAGKMLYNNEVFGASVTPKEAKKRDDKRVAKELHKIIKDVDFVITYNGNKFDIKKINWRFLIHNMPPVIQYGSIDLYRKMKDVFGPASLAMDYVLKELGYNGKHHSDYRQWAMASNGDAGALKDRYEYNVNDVWMMEDLYPRVRGWFKNHPNFAPWLDLHQEFDPSLKLAEDEYRCNRCLKVIHKLRFTLKYQSPVGFFYKVGQCPHCSCLIRETRRMGGQKVRTK